MENRGSQWRKWDLHVHTPASVLQCEYDNDWDRYVFDLFSNAIDNDIQAIGITDYYFIDGYKKLKLEYLSNPEKMISLLGEERYLRAKNILIIPNIEFRLDKLVIGKEKDLKWNRKVNYHLLLCNTIEPDTIEKEIINRLTFDFCVEPGGITDKRIFSKSNLEEFGRKLIECQPSFSIHNPLFVGMMNSCIQLSELTNILATTGKFRGKYIFGLPADEDLSEVSWSSQGHGVRKNLIKQSHVIFSPNSGTIDFCKGMKHEKKSDFVKEFGALKPCVWGSDAHELKRLFKPDGNKNTWIKSDLSFNGLKQIIYEPTSRVKIQELSPQYKVGYQTIKRVRFLSEGNKYSNEWIEFSKDLNAIIGGKSSGKSLLLYFIASSINSDEVSKKLSLSESSGYDEKDIDFEVEWDDGTLSRLSNKEDSKSITYIPQLYINKLAEDEGKHHLKELIERILLQNNYYKVFYDKVIAKINDKDKKIKERIELHQSFQDSYLRNKSESDKIGLKESIEKEVSRLNDVIKTLRERSGLTEEDTKIFSKLNTRLINSMNRINIVNGYKKNTEGFVGGVISKMEFYLDDLKRDITSSQSLPDNGNYIFEYYNIIESGLSKIKDEIVLYKENKLSRIPDLLLSLENEKENTTKELHPYLEKFKEKKTLEMNMKSLSIENEKLNIINAYKKQIDKISIDAKENLINLQRDYAELLECYKSHVAELSSQNYKISGEIQLIPSVKFDNLGFGKFINNYDLRGNLNTLIGESYDSKTGFIFDIENHTKLINQIYLNTKNKNIPQLKKGITKKDLLYTLYDNYFYIDYEVKYKNDEILKMSPGKRGLVLLNLLLHLSNSEHPILVDQPEDNLDNRTIYEQLNEFIRERKLTRQIIIVTHNANLVVAADAECVIVANQSGQIKNGDNEKYQFEYISGSLENSFERNESLPILKSIGIREHVCEILEGGQDAFREREIKYGLKH